jgi:hypothetical protein
MTTRTLSYTDSPLADKKPRLVVIDLCAALVAPRLHLQASLKVLEENGVEVALYSALDAWSTRAALRQAFMLEWFDYIWHMDALRAMEPGDLMRISDAGVLHTPKQLTAKKLMAAAGIDPNRVPAYLRWLL